MSDLTLLTINGNQNIPQVNLNPITGELTFDGRSIIENTIRFFDPIIDWIDEYCLTPAKNTTLHMKMDYFNTSSSKFLLSICEKLEELYKAGNQVEIKWYFTDEDMAELGEDYANVVKIPFVMVAASVA